MSKDSAITVRLPRQLKMRLEERARREHRSISAQVVQELARALTDDKPAVVRDPVPVLGRYKGARLPSDKDFAEVRAAFWGGLGRRRG